MRLPVALALAAAVLVPMPAGIAQAQTTHTCFGEPATVVGTPGDDELQGDVVVGLAGVDDIGGRLVCGGKDGDWHLSGIKVNGGPGDDQEIQLHGSGDLAIGPAIGGPGNDRFLDNNFGDLQPYQVWRGGEGHDRFTPAGGLVDVFYGGAGNDGTGGGEPNWTERVLRQFGGDGNDGLGGGDSKDKICGGAGDDILNATEFGNDTIADFIDGGDGFDTCILGVGDRAVNCEDVTVVG